MLLPRGARQTPPSQLSLLYIKLSLSVLRREGPECSSRLFEFSTDTVGSALENTPGSGPCGAGPGAGPVVCGWVTVCNGSGVFVHVAPGDFTGGIGRSADQVGPG
jgi:hypothetical protein